MVYNKISSYVCNSTIKGYGEMMANFEKSDHIVYDNAGVCFIEDITAKKFDYWDNKRICYVLRPIGNPGSFVYVPVDNEKLTKKMRRIMSKEEIDTILDNVRTQYIIWPDDRRIRMERFKEILYAKNQQDMLMLASCIYTKKKELAACGKKLSSSDEMILKETERFVNEEFSFSLKLSTGQVAAYIQEHLKLI